VSASPGTLRRCPGAVRGYSTRRIGLVAFVDVICGSCPAVEELAARVALVVSLREENDALRVKVKVAALAEIAFGGSGRHGGRGHDSLGDLGDRGDESSGADRDGKAPGLVADDSADADADADADGASGKRRRGQRRGRRATAVAVTIISGCELS